MTLIRDCEKTFRQLPTFTIFHEIKMVLRRNQQKIVLVSKDLADAQFKCTECQKVFISARHVEKHLSRRHGISSHLSSEKGVTCDTSHDKIIEVAGRMENFLDIIEHKTLKDSARLEKLDKSCTTEMDEDLTAQINDSIFSKQFEGRKAISVLTLQKCGGHQFNKNPDHEISRNNEGAREGNFQIGSYRPAIGSGINNAQVNFEIEDAYQKADHEAPSSAKCGDSEKMEKISSYRDAIARLQPLLLTLIGKLDESPDTTKFPGHSVSQTFKSLERAPLAVSSSSVPDFHGDQMEVIFSEPKEKSESEITNDDEFDQETDGTLAESAEDKDKSESEPKSNLENPRAPNCTSASEKKNNENSEQSRTKGNSNNIMSSMNDRKKLSSDASMDCETSAIDYEKVRRQISEALGACEDDQVCEGRSKERKLSLKDINERMREILKSKREDGSVSVEESDKKHQQTQDIEPSKGDTLMESHCVQSMRKSDANLSPISEECPQQNTNSFEEKEKNSCQDRFELKTQKPLKRQADGTEIEARQMPISKAEDELFQQEISECQVLIGELANDLQKWRKTKRTKLTDTIRAQIEGKLSLNLALLGIDKEKWKLTDNEAAVANLVLDRKKMRSTKRTNPSLYDELRSAYADEIDKIARSKLEYPI